MAKPKIIHYCKECGHESPKWLGKCPSCLAWNSFVEEVELPSKPGKAKSSEKRLPQYLHQIEDEHYEGYSSGFQELDRAAGGQLVKGSLILVGGEPGMGKSTLLLQIAKYVADHVGTVMYFSGEESEKQTQMRSKRLSAVSERILVLHTTDIEDVELYANQEHPSLMIVDSIQTFGDPNLNSQPGSPAQIKCCTTRLMQLAKGQGITTIVVGQVTKEAEIAGPKMLEHMVDVVFYLEGDKHSDLRILRVNKNRFGSTSELGVFQMQESGLVEIANPSEHLLSSRLPGSHGSAVACLDAGRPLLIEMQALVAQNPAVGIPSRRTSEGFSRNRLSIILAVLEKICKLYLAQKDVFINVAGGISVDSPGADLAVACAIVSSDKGLSIPHDTVLIGEIGLSGEIRPVAQIEQLVKEAEKVGFSTCFLPMRNYERVKDKTKTLKLIPVERVREVLDALFKKEK